MAFNPSESNVIRTYLAVTGSAPTQQQLENAFSFASLEAFSRDLTAGNTQTNVEFVESLYQNLLGRDADDLGLEYWTSLMSASQGLQAKSKAQIAVLFQYTASLEADLGNEPAMTEALGEIIVSGDLVETDLGFGDVELEEDPEEDLGLILDFTFDTAVGESDVKGWEHTGGDSDEDDSESTNNGVNDADYESQTHKIFNIGKQAVDLNVDSISAQYEFTLKDQLGEQGKYEAYFISPTLDNTSVSQGSSLTLEIIDRTAENDDQALDFVAVESFDFYLNGEQIVVSSNDILNAETYEELRDAIEDAVAAKLAELGIDADELSVTLGNNFTRQQVDPDTLETTGGTVTGKQIVITAATGELDRGTFQTGVKADVGSERNIDPSARMTDRDITYADDLVSTNLVLENVGYGSQGGSINIAGQSQSDKGVQQFDILAQEGNQDLGVWLTELTSIALQDADKANQLEVVNLTGDAAYFFIGQEQEGAILDGYGVDGDGDAGLTDVRDFDGSDFDGEIQLVADITDNVIARDFDLMDDASNPSADNVEYDYTTGGGNDELYLDVSQEAVAFEDFKLDINTGAGNDYVEVELVNNAGQRNDELDNNLDTNWVADQRALDNINISTGAGDDVIWTPGSGDAVIDAGAGDDVIYTDNTASKAVWILNSVNSDIDDIAGSGAASDSAFLYGATLTFDFLGYSAEVDVPTNDKGIANAARINQAIKEAVNNDPVLQNLLVATDGPNNSLVLTSKIDGAMGQENVPSFSFTPLVDSVEDYNALSNTDKNAIVNALTVDSDSNITPTSAVTALANGANGFATTIVLATEGTSDVADMFGNASSEESGNTIVAGSGDDVIVLSTGTGSDVVTFTSYDLGNKSIVNFNTDDVLDFSSYLTSQYTTSGSDESAKTTYNYDTAGRYGSETIDYNFTEGDDDTWGDLSESALENALKDSLGDGGSEFDGLTSAQLDSYLDDIEDDYVALGLSDDDAGLVEAALDHVLGVVNTDNAGDGEIRYFHVTTTYDYDDNELSISDVKEIVTVDLGNIDLTNTRTVEIDGDFELESNLGYGNDTLTLNIDAGIDNQTDTINATVDFSDTAGTDRVLFNFEDVNDVVVLTSGSEISGFETLEVSGGTLDITNLAEGALDGVNVVINSGLTLSVAQLIELVTSGGSVDTETLGSGLNIELEDATDVLTLQNFLANAANVAALDAILGASSVGVSLNVVDTSDEQTTLDIDSVVDSLVAELSNVGAVNTTDTSGITTLRDGTSFDASSLKGEGRAEDDDPTVDLTNNVLEESAEVTVIVAEFDSENGNKSDLAEVAKSDQLVVLPDLADLNDGTLVIENFTMATQVDTEYTTNDVLDFSNTSEATDAAALAGLIESITITAGDGDYLDFAITFEVDGDETETDGTIELANIINEDIFDYAVDESMIANVTGMDATYSDGGDDNVITDADAIADLVGLIAAGGTFEYA